MKVIFVKWPFCVMVKFSCVFKSMYSPCQTFWEMYSKHKKNTFLSCGDL